MKVLPIPGYETYYLIDEEGNVYSQPRVAVTGIGPMTRPVGGRMLKPFLNGKKKQKCVKLNKGNRRVCHQVSTLLKRTFGA